MLLFDGAVSPVAAAPIFRRPKSPTDRSKPSSTCPTRSTATIRERASIGRAQIPSLEFQGHTFFGQWFEKYDPKLHDAIMGPVEEFLTNGAGLGYAEAKPGENFVKIGVGAIRKPEEAASISSAPTRSPTTASGQ